MGGIVAPEWGRLLLFGADEETAANLAQRFGDAVAADNGVIVVGAPVTGTSRAPPTFRYVSRLHGNPVCRVWAFGLGFWVLGLVLLRFLRGGGYGLLRDRS